MKFSEKRKLKKEQKVRMKMLENSWDFDIVRNCTENPLFQDCHIQEEITDKGEPTGKYWLIPETRIRKVIEKKG